MALATLLDDFCAQVTESRALCTAAALCTLAVAAWAVLQLCLRLRALVTGWAPDKVLIVDIACFRVPERLRMGQKEIVERLTARAHETNGAAMPASIIEFTGKVLKTSGIGDQAGVPEAIHRLMEPGNKPLGQHGEFITLHSDNMAESEMVLFDVVEKLLKKTGLTAKDIDAVATSCSCFAPTPSMAAMIVNKFKMRTDVITYSLAGMGCSSSLVCVDMVNHLLQSPTMRNKRVLVVNHENITNCWYNGLDKSMAIVNCLFRVGGAAILYSNRLDDAWRAKYELQHCNRVHLGCQDDAFGCMGNSMDTEHKYGVYLKRNVIEIAGRALRLNVTKLAPYVLPYTELAKCLLDKNYTPAFNRAFDHYLLHTGGRGVLESLEKNLSLANSQMAPSYATLQRFGNTSSASTWYILSYLERAGAIRKGNKIWQLGFGGGFKSHSAVWRARRSIKEDHDCWT